ncbi:hypothetical protein [Parapedobacter koreensis]|nr:hypothetical protein [Parapedobacter koreensis]
MEKVFVSEHLSVRMRTWASLDRPGRIFQLLMGVYQAQSFYVGKVLNVSCNQSTLLYDCGGSNDGIGEFDLALFSQCNGLYDHIVIHMGTTFAATKNASIAGGMSVRDNNSILLTTDIVGSASMIVAIKRTPFSGNKLAQKSMTTLVSNRYFFPIRLLGPLFACDT